MKNKTWIFTPLFAIILMFSSTLSGQETIILGNNAEPTSSDQCNSALNYVRYECVKTFSATQMFVHIAVSGPKIKGAIYSDLDGVADTLMGITNHLTNPPTGWNSFDFTSPVRLDSGSFYCLAQRGDTAGWAMSCSDGLPGTPYRSYPDWNDWPSPFGTISPWDAKTYLIYVSGPEITTKMEMVKTNKFKVYPNPVSDELTIEMADNDIRNFEIYNSVGQSIYKGKISQKAVIPTSNFTPGFYSVKIENGNSVDFRKIVKL